MVPLVSSVMFIQKELGISEHLLFRSQLIPWRSSGHSRVHQTALTHLLVASAAGLREIIKLINKSIFFLHQPLWYYDWCCPRRTEVNGIDICAIFLSSHFLNWLLLTCGLLRCKMSMVSLPSAQFFSLNGLRRTTGHTSWAEGARWPFSIALNLNGS